MLDQGLYATVSEIGDAENISKSYVSRILRLALLAPSIVEQILDGQADQSLMLERLERPLPASWPEQRRLALARCSSSSSRGSPAGRACPASENAVASSQAAPNAPKAGTNASSSA
jgi:hypothetical protein